MKGEFLSQEKKEAVLLMGFGGPQNLEEVPFFLRELFFDPCILPYPSFIRKPLSFVIAKLSEKRAKASYAKLGGRSPYVDNTKAQAKALETKLRQKVFVAMRYGHPSLGEVEKKIKDYNPSKLTILPLYPQFSLTTTLSSLNVWRALSKKAHYKTQVLCCYPREKGFVEAYADNLEMTLQKLPSTKNVRVLFSAHGTPLSLVKKGDPYTHHVNQTARAIKKKVQEKYKNLDTVVCYQSRVGFLPWTEPYLEDEIKRAAAEKKNLVVLPIAFICEHSETKVELDIDYKELAEELGIIFKRVPTVSCHPAFIEGLANLVRKGFVKNACSESVAPRKLRCFCEESYA